jgi:hypothetical protein
MDRPKCKMSSTDRSCRHVRTVEGILLVLGLFILIYTLLGCSSWQTSDCKTDNAGIWRCKEK